MAKSSSFPRRPARGPSQRQLRVGEVVRHALVEILAREDVRDPDLLDRPVTVTQVTVTPDLKAATVYCASLGGRADDVVVAALNRCRSYLRGQLGRRLTLKYTPSLTFKQDRSFDQASAIDALLHSPRVARDLTPRRPGEADRQDDE